MAQAGRALATALRMLGPAWPGRHETSEAASFHTSRPHCALEQHVRSQHRRPSTRSRRSAGTDRANAARTPPPRPAHGSSSRPGWARAGGASRSRRAAGGRYRAGPGPGRPAAPSCLSPVPHGGLAAHAHRPRPAPPPPPPAGQAEVAPGRRARLCRHPQHSVRSQEAPGGRPGPPCARPAAAVAARPAAVARSPTRRPPAPPARPLRRRSNEMMLQEAGEFANHLKKIEKDIRGLKNATESAWRRRLGSCGRGSCPGRRLLPTVAGAGTCTLPLHTPASAPRAAPPPQASCCPPRRCCRRRCRACTRRRRAARWCRSTPARAAARWCCPSAAPTSRPRSWPRSPRRRPRSWTARCWRPWSAG